MQVIDHHIASKARELVNDLPAGTWNLISRLKRDLYDGSVYLAPADTWPFEMVEVDCFDEGAVQFDFSDACDELGDILEELPTLYYDYNSGCWDSAEPQGYWMSDTEFTYEEPDDAGEEDEDGEPYWTWVEPEVCYVVTGSEFKRALLGEQLAGYV